MFQGTILIFDISLNILKSFAWFWPVICLGSGKVSCIQSVYNDISPTLIGLLNFNYVVCYKFQVTCLITPITIITGLASLHHVCYPGSSVKVVCVCKNAKYLLVNILDNKDGKHGDGTGNRNKPGKVMNGLTGRLNKIPRHLFSLLCMVKDNTYLVQPVNMWTYAYWGV